MLSSPNWNLKCAHGYCEKNNLSWTFLFFHYGTHFYSVQHATSKREWFWWLVNSHLLNISSKLQRVKTDLMMSHRTVVTVAPTWPSQHSGMKSIHLGKLNFDKYLCRALQILIQLSHLWDWYYHYHPPLGQMSHKQVNSES